MYQKIIETIRKELSTRHITQAEFADMCGYAASSIGNWLTFETKASYIAVEDMLNTLGYTLIMEVKENVE